MKVFSTRTVSDGGKALDRLIARALVAEPTAGVRHVWGVVPEARVLPSDELRERIGAQMAALRVSELNSQGFGK